MSSKGIRAGAAFVELFGEDTPLAKTLRSWQGKLQQWGDNVSKIGKAALAAGAAALAPLGVGVKMFADSGSQIDDIAQRTGAGAEAISTLGYAAARTGTSIDDLEKGLIRTQKVVVAAAQGNQAAAEALGKVGLSAAQLAALSPEDQFRAIARAINTIPNPAERTAAAVSLLGKSGPALIPLANEMDDLEQRARDLGIAMSEGDVAAAAQLGDAFDDLKAVGSGLANAIGAALAPAVTKGATAVIDAAAAVIAWVKEHRRAVVIAATLAAGVAVLGAGLYAAGVVMTTLAAIAGAAVTIMGALSAAAGALGVLFAFLATPVGLVLVAIAALIGAFVALTDIGQQAALGVLDAWNSVTEAILGAQEAAAEFAKRPMGSMKFGAGELAALASNGLGNATRAGNGFVDARSAAGYTAVLKSLRQPSNPQAKMAKALEKMVDGQERQIDAEERAADALEGLEVGQFG